MLRFLFPLCALLLWLPMAGLQAEQQEPSLQERTEAWRATLTAAQAALSNDFEERSLAEVMADLRRLQVETQTVRRDSRARLREVERTLERLGPAPAEGEPPEGETLRGLRQELRQAATEFSDRASIAEAAEARAADLQESIAAWEQERFRSRLAELLPRPWMPEVWHRASLEGLEFVNALISAPVDWWEEHRRAGDAAQALAVLIVLPLIGLIAGWPLRKWILRRFGRGQETAPTYARRIVAAVADGAANAVVPVVIIALVVLALTLQGLLTGQMALLVYVASAALAAYLVFFGLTQAALAPYQVAWRIVPVDPARVRLLLGAIRITALVAVAGTALLTLMLYTGRHTPHLESVFFLLLTTGIGITAGWTLSPAYWITSVEESQDGGSVEEASERLADAATEAEQDDTRPLLDVARSLLRTVVVIAPFGALLGYGRLAYFAQSRLLGTAVLIGLGLLLRLAVRELIQQFYLNQPIRRYGAAGVRAPSQSERSVQGMIFWTGLVADLLIFVPLVYLLLLLYGVPPTTLLLWTQSLFSGITIGGFTLAPGNFLIAVLVFMAGLIATNIVRRWLTRTVLPNTRLEFGARSSIAAGTSYLGVGIAVLLAMGALGLDFTNLALVVGALSLGIGFGLRNVVENFVAGVLLLIERPIKVGDWIIIGQHEGTVRHISVRSTEIETFDRAAVIVPNAELISTSVINWTHKNRMARERIPVGVAYGSDTEQVAQILLQCARTHSKVLRAPPPVALFVGFGDSSLNFELRCFIGDTDDFMTVRSELHFALEKALREAGVSIPFPQRDVHLHRPARRDSTRPDEGDSGTTQPST
ncbi:small-conductance mechanosensitive channel [Natronocella acetinitrilica]|uniref:Small-conductance mechanosensitive channel n=2 Tax=Natronocella acetinitrilica TaxID=414046 RepID=A0AAE3G209_9GAMM|nr:small-conductance mechanosensitive channel [Natronocella acetinitrilica]